MFDRLSNILQNNELHVTKCEPWNSVKVTFNLPKDAAEKLSKLAEAGDDVLRELGILSLEMEGGQVVSMTVSEEDGEDATPGPAKSSPAVCKPKISPKEEKSIKQEPEGSQSPAYSGRPPGLAFPLLQSSAAALLLKNHSSSSSSEQSVLHEGLLASLIQSNSKAGSVSSLLGHNKDNGEPVNKKPRTEPESSQTAPSKLEGANNFPYKGTAAPGFSLLPVSVSTPTTRSVTGSQSNNSSDSVSVSNTRTSPSALRIASLPGVSLTAVSSSPAGRNTQLLSSSHSQKLCKASLMPPPNSGVTLCPVPRTTATVSPLPPPSSSPAELRCIETGDISSPKSLVTSDNISSSSSSSSTSSISSTQSLEPRPPLLINPVTGQFEAGAGLEAEQDNNKNQDPDSDDAMEDLKHKSGSQSPGISTSEPSSLKVKLKVSSIVPTSNNSSKNLISPKNDVMLKTTSNSSVTSKSADEPKVPKIKIRLGKDKNAVKLNSNDLVENHDGNDLDDTFSSADKSHNSPLQNDLKTKIKIKPLDENPTEEENDSVVNNITSPHFPNLTNSIVNHTCIEDRKKKKDKMKDRLAVWTESLAKHGQREESKEKEEKVKETKSWPEVLEARLFGNSSGGSNSSNSNSNSSSSSSSSVLSFSKSETVLENQTDKGEPDSPEVAVGGEELAEEEESSESSESSAAHLNYRGPGQDLPGPGLVLPASPQSQPSPDRADPHDEAGECSAASQPNTSHSLTAVLDILEGRPSLGEPLSPDCPRQSQDQAGQQGEDSGIESMDSRSEKSPNQGESPFHASSECGVELGRTPTYSSSMGPSSGKVSPPVSDPDGCSDSTSPPDKSPPVTSSTQPVQLNNTESSILTRSVSDSVNGKNNFLEESHEVTIPPNHSEDPPFNKESAGENHANPINSKIEIINSNGTPSGPSSAELSEKASIPFVNHQESSKQPKTENGGSSFESNKNDLESKSEDLLRSCDGADDLKILPTGCQAPEITNCMVEHDYIFKDSNNPDEASSESVATAVPDPVKALISRRVPEVSGSPISVSVRPALHVPPGARMVPVKLVTVPGAGNVRMLRVSPVKSGIITTVDGKVPGVLPPRTVVIKSSVLRTVSSQEVGAASLPATPSLVSFPGQTVNCDSWGAAGPGDASQSVSQSSIVTFSQLKKSHQVKVSLTPVENSSTPSSFSADSTKAAPVTFQKRVSLEDSQVNSSLSNSETPLSVDVSNRLTDAEQMPSPAQKAAQKFQHQKVNGEEALETLPASPKPERMKRKKSNSGDLLKNDNSDGESLLRPLLAKEETDQASSLQPSSPLPGLDSPSSLTLPLVNPRKRTRRDTGSSVNSDRSDQSGGEGPGKGRRKSQAGDSTDSDEKQKSLKLKSEQSNGISEEASSSSKKTLKSVERTKGRPTITLKNSTNTNNKVELKKSNNPKKTGIVKKVGRPSKLDEQLSSTEKGTIKTDNSGRRVSTRSKKPDEAVAATNKRR